MLSVHVAVAGSQPAYSLNDDVRHLAASTMKVGVLAALHRSDLDLDRPVTICDAFESAVTGRRFRTDPARDSDPLPWRLVGSTATLRWLAQRMIVHSSNLATNVCLSHVGFRAVAEIWRLAGASHSVTARGIDDVVARDAGIENVVTAADLARLFAWLPETLHGILAANVHRVDIAAGLPAGTRVAFKNGWCVGLRHAAGIVFPDDAGVYTIAVCYSGPSASGDDIDDPAARLLARVSGDVWERRSMLGISACDAGAWPAWDLTETC